jgi:hypothetical protein
MPGGARTGRGLAGCPVQWRIRPRTGRADNRGKEPPAASPGRRQVEPVQRIAWLPGLIREVKLVTAGGRPARYRRPPEEVSTALLEFLSQAELAGIRRPVLMSACGTTRA